MSEKSITRFCPFNFKNHFKSQDLLILSHKIECCFTFTIKLPYTAWAVNSKYSLHPTALANHF